MGAAATFCLGAALQAQGNTAAIAGHALDRTGAALSGATITVSNTDNASVRTLSAGRDGAFRVAGLVPGAYTVEARAGSLATRRPVRLTVTLGSSTQVRLELGIAPVKQSADGERRGPGRWKATRSRRPRTRPRPPTGTFLPGLTVTYLPNRDRDFSQFTDQVAATVDDPDGTGISIAGQRSTATALEVDGTRYIDPLLGGPRGVEQRRAVAAAERRSRVPGAAQRGGRELRRDRRRADQRGVKVRHQPRARGCVLHGPAVAVHLR